MTFASRAMVQEGCSTPQPCLRPLFGGENDFQIVLKEAFPDLRTRRLTRRQWGMIRRMMGKPRRCSQVGVGLVAVGLELGGAGLNS
ncbi:Protein lin-9 [Portunus trituberculatus]|uniref:Protein lin-9 n=1 Tax=Portunus trituberculatus TaxID=210409 RepID=A0A5B7CMU8_PORTR|nr:Protein lin-9 [Portunus trituberculatus]